MKSRITENPSLKKALRRAYLSREQEVIEDHGQFQVMRRVRAIGPISVKGFWPDFERVVWRLAPVSCMLILALSILFGRIGTDFSSDYLGTVTAELDQPSTSELFEFGG